MNQKQNDFVEKLAKDAAAANRPADWRLTPISEKSAARVTCPFRNNGFVPDGWWEKTEPRWPDGTPSLGPTAPDPFLEYSRQNKRNRQGMKIVDKIVTKYAHDGVVDIPAPAFEQHLPGPNVDLREWLKNYFVVRVNTNRTPYGSLLRSYIEKSKLGSRLGDVNEHTIRTLVQAICEGESR